MLNPRRLITPKSSKLSKLPRMNNEYVSEKSTEVLKKHIKELQTFSYKHSRGNAGDALIYSGMCQLLGKLNCGSAWLGKEDPIESKNIVYSGGGALTEYYNNSSDFIEHNFSKFKTFTLLPSTISGHERLLKKLDSRFHIFCRDEVSYSHCKQLCDKSVSLYRHQDLAFFNKVETYTTFPVFSLPTFSIQKNFEWLKKQKKVRNFIQKEGTSFLRNDLEAPTQELLVDNLDISQELGIRQKNHMFAIRISKAFLASLSFTNIIHTNRLHVSIAGALLGKQTYLYPNSYHKNLSVYKASIEGRFPNVTFKD